MYAVGIIIGKRGATWRLYSNFTLASAVAEFGLTITTQSLFPHVPRIETGTWVRYMLDTYGPLAVGINTEKARSEWLIAPLLGEVWNRGRGSLFLLSGVDFTVDKEKGLTGVVDFMIGRGPNCRSSSAQVARSWRWSR